MHPLASADNAVCDFPNVAPGTAVRSRSFRWLSIAFALSAVVTTGVSVHLISLLLERGHSATFAGAAMGTLGLMALPGRLVFTPLGSRWPRAFVTAGIFLLSALGVVALMRTEGSAGVWIFVALFGAGFGAITPTRAALIAELYGRIGYGTISGMLALIVAVARAAAPIGLSLLHTAFGGYQGVLWTLLLVCLACGAAVLGTGTGLRPLAPLPTPGVGRRFGRSAGLVRRSSSS